MVNRVCDAGFNRWTLWMALVLLLRHSSGSFPSPTSRAVTSSGHVVVSGQSVGPPSRTATRSPGREPLFSSAAPEQRREDALSGRTVRAIDPGEANSRNLPSPTAQARKGQPVDDLHLVTNEVEARLPDYYRRIQPTKTTPADRVEHTGEVLATSVHHSRSGEEYGGPQGRSLPLLEGPGSTGPAPPSWAATATPTLAPSHRSDESRKTNPDIQDIITGIVKLLNGNVKVQANPNLPPGAANRPARPLPSRINNRGPPRITDLPMLPPDFAGAPPPQPTRLPPPYPFDLPPGIVPLPPQPPLQSDRPFVTGVPLPEQVVPVAAHRPHRPQRPRPTRPRPGLPPVPSFNPHRPPLPGQPVNKPPARNTTQQPVFLEAEVSELTTDLQPPSSDQVSLYEEEAHGTEREEEATTTTKAPTTTTAKPTTKPPTKPTTKPPTKPTTKPPTKPTTKPTTKPSTKPTTKPTTPRPAKTTTSRPEKATSTTSEASTPEKKTSPVTEAPQEDKSPGKDVPAATRLTPPALLEPSTGVGSAVPVLESSMLEIMMLDSSTSSEGPSTAASTPPITSLSELSNTVPPHTITEGTGFSYFPFKPRPGIVLDDTEYKPGKRPIITAAAGGYPGEAFDVTVSAVQGPGGGAGSIGQPFIYPVEMEGVSLPGAGDGEVSVITTPKEGQHFVSIDGKRTYFNLFSSTTETGIAPSRVTPDGAKPLPSSAVGTGFAVPQPVAPFSTSSHTQSGAVNPPPIRRRPMHPPVRIDTCIVGDDSTCDSAHNEMCRTEAGVSSCHCRPSYSRRKHREPCRRVASILMSLRVDKLYERKLAWSNKLQDPDSEQYQQLAWEAARAIDSAMSMTPFSDDFLGTRVNGMYTSPARRGSVFVNVTLQLEESAETLRPAVRLDIQRHLLGVIHRRNNNIGDSALWVDNPPGSVSHLQDVDECSQEDLHDCHARATCSNVFGSFRCECAEGYRDPWSGDPHRSGRQCAACSPDHCSSRGECRYQDGQQVCRCTGNFYGSQCEVDGEVLGVAVGASVAAVVIILLTVVCLCMWSRRWNREQKTAAGMGSPVFGYMGTAGSSVKTPGVGAPPYQVSLEDRLRWAQIADVMAQANHYAQPEPVNAPTRPSSAVFGYPSLNVSGTLPHMGPPPVPLPRLGLSHGAPTICSQRVRTPDRTVESTSSDEEDHADLLGRNFHVPRPKSRSSIANQSGIYYDVDYDQSVYGTTTKSHHTAIPLSTYGRPPYYRQ